MHSRVAALFFLASTVAATAVPRNDPHNQQPTESCSTGSLQCCNSVQDSLDLSLTSLLGLLGVVVGDLTGLVGVTCSPITVVGTGTSSCSAQTVCCTNTSFNGLVALGCTPININL
ncbi:hypothetical protein AMATHDRAFT_153138 [Amanita thiersii Skay4041]|uniref:Hydrophobin n=1 Tax=Amanita thiersii Skay4041 TaxID=703135 RepID=A0A2A9NCH4_9AGAR|nr:hypothetical protein AMATHDRAFT_153138 [Amanita thiersii Skay4041]